MDNPKCSYCNGTGMIACRSRDAQYAFAGPVPDDAKGYFDADCWYCDSGPPLVAVPESEMSEEKHTPGPWLKRYYDRVTRSDDIDGSKSIAHVYGWREHPSAQQANRDLIAASPELLAHAKIVVFHLRRGDHLDSRCVGQMIDALEGVIAKAEGAVIAEERGTQT